MKQVLIKRGQAIVADVPSPEVSDDNILVQVKCSCISIGTEMSGVRGSGVPLWKKALQQPDKVKKVLMVKEVSKAIKVHKVLWVKMVHLLLLKVHTQHKNGNL